MSAPRHTSRIGSCPTWPTSLAPSGSSAAEIPSARSGPTGCACSSAISSSRQFSARVLRATPTTNVDVRQLDPRPRPCHAAFTTAKQFAVSVGVTLGRFGRADMSVGSSRDLGRGVRQAGGAMVLWGRIRRLVFRLAPLSAALLLSGCDWAVLNPKGPVADANATLLVDSVAIMLVIVVPTILATLAAAWWSRSSNTRARYLPDFEYSGQLELIVWAIPLFTIMLLGGVTWIGAHDLDPARPIVSTEEPLNIQVVSLDWKWLFIYPDQHVASVDRLVVPAGVPIRFALTSGSVMTAFFVPQL